GHKRRSSSRCCGSGRDGEKWKLSWRLPPTGSGWRWYLENRWDGSGTSRADAIVGSATCGRCLEFLPTRSTGAQMTSFATCTLTTASAFQRRWRMLAYTTRDMRRNSAWYG